MAAGIEARIDPLAPRQRKALLAFALVAGMFVYAFRLVRVQGHSMDPTYHNGQWLLIRRFNWPSPPPRVGDVVVFRLDHELLVKRIAALGGQPLPDEESEPPIQPLRRRPGTWKRAIPALASGQVPEGQLYVLGDNPPVSDDSRSFGPVPVTALVGRVLRWNEPGRPPNSGQQSAAR